MNIHHDFHNSEDDEDFALLISVIAIHYYTRRRTYQSRGWLHSGQVFVDNLLESGHDTRIRSTLRIALPTFCKLRDWLNQNTELDSSRISIEEKLVMFLFIAGIEASSRTA